MKLERSKDVLSVGETIDLPKGAIVVFTTPVYIIVQKENADLLVIFFE